MAEPNYTKYRQFVDLYGEVHDKKDEELWKQANKVWAELKKSGE